MQMAPTTVPYSGLAREVFAFYDSFNDTKTLIYKDEFILTPRIPDLCASARELLHFCVWRCMKNSEASALYEYTAEMLHTNFISEEFRNQFPRAHPS